MAIKSIEWLGFYEAEKISVKSEWMRDEVVRIYKVPKEKIVCDLNRPKFLDKRNSQTIQQRGWRLKEQMKDDLAVMMLSWEFPPRVIGGISPHVYFLSKSLQSRE